MLKKQTIVLGVSGGIAAYKTVDLVKLLKKQGFDVFVVLTQSATNFVKPAQLRRVTGHKVYTDLFEPKFDYRKILTKRKVEHIELADKADLILIVPATANLLAKLAHGIADDFLTTTVLATRAPVMICPAMNSNMWQHPAVKDNLSRLQSLGYQIINPVAGM
ncbi:MAG: flavoprotein, partial [Patescibacteria group bacterium]|nr:flavoprotein [Patescibacteria group bacterium]